MIRLKHFLSRGYTRLPCIAAQGCRGAVCSTLLQGSLSWLDIGTLDCHPERRLCRWASTDDARSPQPENATSSLQASPSRALNVPLLAEAKSWQKPPLGSTGSMQLSRTASGRAEVLECSLATPASRDLCLPRLVFDDAGHIQSVRHLVHLEILLFMQLVRSQSDLLHLSGTIRH